MFRYGHMKPTSLQVFQSIRK